KKKENALSQLTYDYSKARDEVRKKFEKFENEAKSFGFTRSQSETVNEWFSRMGWQQYHQVYAIYNNVRYGSHNPTQDEQKQFEFQLDKLRERFFLKKE